MGSFRSFRKAYGALRDSTKVGLAKVNGEYKDLDSAIVKATNHVEYAPKERHIRKISVATSAHQPRADVAYCIHALSRRLSKTRSWIEHSRTRTLRSDELLEQLPALQQFLYRLYGCQPQGAAYSIFLIQYALAMFFDMSRHEAVKALHIYKRAGQQAKHLADFYEYCKGLTLLEISSSQLYSSHLHIFLPQRKNTSKKHHRPALFKRDWSIKKLFSQFMN